ncbi:hypothetical protein TNCV_1361781 [Trichonephila clavipes]|nr:hypothetical protein TNCV_1361781 [Trichonephila clavipes]
MLVRTDRRIRQLIIRDPFSTTHPNVTSEAGCLKKWVDLCPLKPYTADSVKMNGVHLAVRHEGQKVNRIVMTSERMANCPPVKEWSKSFARFLQLSSGGFLNLHHRTPVGSNWT